LLAGDSGRKIAEVIDLRGVIYQGGSRAGGGTNGERAYTCTEPRVGVRISGKGKRGRESFRCDSQSVPRRERQRQKERERERERGGRTRAMKSRR